MADKDKDDDDDDDKEDINEEDDSDEDPTGEPFECKLLDGGEWPLPLLESLTGGVKFCGFRLKKKRQREKENKINKRKRK